MEQVTKVLKEVAEKGTSKKEQEQVLGEKEELEKNLKAKRSETNIGVCGRAAAMVGEPELGGYTMSQETKLVQAKLIIDELQAKIEQLKQDKCMMERYNVNLQEENNCLRSDLSRME